MLTSCSVPAGGHCLFDVTFRRANPQKFAVLMATFFGSLGVGKVTFPVNAEKPAAQYMLCLLTDMNDMPRWWQSKEMQPILLCLTKELPSIRPMLTLVSTITLLHLQLCYGRQCRL